MKKISICILLITFNLSVSASPCVPKKHAVVPNITGKTYHQARKQLLANQWQPFSTISHNEAEEVLRFSGNGLDFWNKGYSEVEACAGTGMAPCVFNFSDVYGNNLKVYTSGEELADQKIYARVDSYGFYCGR